MRTVLNLIALFFITFNAQSQAYTEFNVPNVIPMSEMIIEIEKDEAFYVLNHQVGTTLYTYLLINKTSVVYAVPTLPAGWSSQTLYKANKAIMPFDVGGTILVVLDSAGNSYIRIH